MTPDTIKPDIILVEDHLIFRQGIKAIINFENLGTVIGEASNGTEFMSMLQMHKPDLVLMDIDMPGMDGFEATKRALETNPNMKIIIFSVFEDEVYFKRMMELGAKGFILKTSGLNELETAIQKVMNDEHYFSNEFNKTASNGLNNSEQKETVDPVKDIPKSKRKMLFFPWVVNRRIVL